MSARLVALAYRRAHPLLWSWIRYPSTPALIQATGEAVGAWIKPVHLLMAVRGFGSDDTKWQQAPLSRREERLLITSSTFLELLSLDWTSLGFWDAFRQWRSSGGDLLSIQHELAWNFLEMEGFSHCEISSMLKNFPGKQLTQMPILGLCFVRKLAHSDSDSRRFPAADRSAGPQRREQHGAGSPLLEKPRHPFCTAPIHAPL